MPIDGCFIHYLVNELNNELNNAIINKIYEPSPTDIILELRVKGKNYNLLLSSSLNSPRICIYNDSFQNPDTPYNFCMVLRKYIERGTIKSITQYNNDRIVILNILTHNELLDDYEYYLILELMGRNSNLILTNNDYIILDSLRKLSISEDNDRLIIPHAKYEFKKSLNNINPFTCEIDNINDLQGVSKKLLNELNNKSSEEIKKYLNQKINPVTYLIDNKLDFYAYPLNDDIKVINSYNNLSDLINDYYKQTSYINNSKSIELINLIKKELKKNVILKDHLESDLDTAKENLKLENIGILLQSNLYKVNKGDKELIVSNYFNNNEEVIIKLDPLLDPSDNLKKIFNIIKKAKKALIKVNDQIELVNNEIDYLNNTLFDISISSNDEIDEIKLDLFNHGILKQKKFKSSKKFKINLLKYEIDDCLIYIGKNSIQNDYLTNKVAASNDLWFHVKDMPGSHVVIHVPNNDKNYVFTEELIRFSANKAAYYSKAKLSSSVPVDYTYIKYVKKINGISGYHVTYTNQHTIYIDPKE